MKKILLSLASFGMAASMMAGGLVTNTNQSASYTRMMCRDATTGVDAVYYNPAGLTRLDKGLHISLSNQTISQTKTITSDYSFLSGTKPVEYTGKVSAPLFPSVYAAFKLGKFVVSAGFNPVGGGGGAEYLGGLPSFEMPIASILPAMVSQLQPLDQGAQAIFGTDPQFSNITSYGADIQFTGSSVYYGTQLNLSYEVNKMISVAAGARYVMAKNTYTGSVSNVMINAEPNPSVGLTSPYNGTPGDYLRLVASHPYAIALGADGNLNSAAALVDQGTDIEVDVVQEGSGITPIVGVNITPVKMLNLSLKYEHKTKLELITSVNEGKDGGGMYSSGDTLITDMPAMLSVGAALSPGSKLLISAGVHYYFDKNNDYDGNPSGTQVEMIDNNFIEYGLGLEYKVFGPLSVSAGYLGTKTGVNDLYQSDLRYSLDTHTLGTGLKLSLTSMLDINLGASMTVYQDGEKSFAYPEESSSLIVTETYDTETWVVAVGVDLHF